MELKTGSSESLCFAERRQRVIQEGLEEVFGVAVARLFRDASRIMEQPLFENNALLVAHLLRELEGAVRAVCRPFRERRVEIGTRQESENSHKQEILDILKSLGLDQNADVRTAWLLLKDELHGFAHRPGLEEARGIEEIVDKWRAVQDLLDVLVAALRERFLGWISVLDELLRKKTPTKADLKRLRHEVPNNHVTRGYFFTRLDHRGWLEPLAREGFFSRPPKPNTVDSGITGVTWWPQGNYLVRMASLEPETVAGIIKKIRHTENLAVLGDLVDALTAMPAEVSVQLAEVTRRWASLPNAFLRGKVIHLVHHWAKAGWAEEALSLAHVALDIFPTAGGPGSSERSSAGLQNVGSASRDRFNESDCRLILGEICPDLVLELGVAWVEVLVELLEKALLRSSFAGENNSVELVPSYNWRPHIGEDSPASIRQIENDLVSLLRDAALRLVKTKIGMVGQVLQVLESKPLPIFRRIALYVLTQSPKGVIQFARSRLTDRSLFENLGLREEYVFLLKRFFPGLSRSAQLQILRWIHEAREIEGWPVRRSSGSGQAASPEERVRYREQWQLKWLAYIPSKELPKWWRQKRRQLTRKYGEPDRKSFFSWEWTATRYESVAAKRAEELMKSPISEIVDSLKHRNPRHDDLRVPDVDGLARQLSTTVAQDPERLVAHWKDFCCLEPRYVSALLSGLSKGLNEGAAFDWEPVFALCEWVLSQPRRNPADERLTTDRGPDWGCAREAVADLLCAGFARRLETIPFALRSRAWHLLKVLTEDPDPPPPYRTFHCGTRERNCQLADDELEQRVESNPSLGDAGLDPVLSSSKTVRVRAMDAVFHYARWVGSHLGQESSEPVRDPFSRMPEVQEVLESHLDPRRERSLAIRAVYGWWFEWLVRFQPDWARRHAQDIFPHSTSERDFFEAAWDAYVTFCTPPCEDKDRWVLFYPVYRFAVEEVGLRQDRRRFPWDPRERLAEHLMAFCYCGTLPLEDPLLLAFWKNASDTLRAHAVAFVGRQLRKIQAAQYPNLVERLKRLWESRLAVALNAQTPSDFQREIGAFGWWVSSGAFEFDWAIGRLAECLRIVEDIDGEHEVFEYLAEKVALHPQKSVQCLKTILEKARLNVWEIRASRNEIQQILEKGLRSPEAREDAVRVVHLLCSRSLLEFGQLLEERPC